MWTLFYLWASGVPRLKKESNRSARFTRSLHFLLLAEMPAFKVGLIRSCRERTGTCKEGGGEGGEQSEEINRLNFPSDPAYPRPSCWCFCRRRSVSVACVDPMGGYQGALYPEGLAGGFQPVWVKPLNSECRNMSLILSFMLITTLHRFHYYV